MLPLIPKLLQIEKYQQHEDFLIYYPLFSGCLGFVNTIVYCSLITDIYLLVVYPALLREVG
jgi:hypothetical protein